jgi:2-keto-4-pentenoate hydratase/2-oxohepta-3-ene-1,7-dioic acid hydratase in catechol pathway
MKIARYRLSTGGLAWAIPGNPPMRLEGELFGELRETGEAISGECVAPLDPYAILCVGLNYRRHAEETGGTPPAHPVLFMKMPSAVIGSGQQIEIPRHLRSERVDFECELAVIIGRTAKNVSRENALSHVFGYTCANDVSARDWQIKFGGSQWCRGKTFDTFCPLGPHIVTADEIPDPSALHISTTLNGKRVQDSPTSDMIFDVPAIIEFLSGSTTLRPGTVILTGTPHGVGMARKPPLWLQPGDTVEIEIDRIGCLINPVIEEPRQAVGLSN